HMKFLKKASLAAAIAAASISAQAGMVALDDETMAATTGQAGVTIELNLQTGTGNDAAVKVGGIDYTDDGQIQIDNVWVGTENPAGIIIKQDIDVEANGQLKIKVDPVTGLKVGVGAVYLAARTGAGTASDPYVYTQADGTNSEALVGNVNLGIDLGPSTTLIGAKSTFAAADVAKVTGAGVTDASMVISSDSSLKITSGSLEALGGGVKVRNLTFDDNGNNAVIKQKIFASDKGLNIVMESITGDLRIGDITLGKAASAASIGSVTVSDIVLAGVTQTIYGH